MSSRIPFQYHYDDTDTPLRPSSPSPTIESYVNDVNESVIDDSIEIIGNDESTPYKEKIPIPDWYALPIDKVYELVNPISKEGKLYQREWRNQVVDCNGKPIHSIGIIANRLLKLMVTKKLIPDLPINLKMQSKKGDRLLQLYYFDKLKTNVEHVTLVKKFLTENIILPVNLDGDVVEPDNVNILARVLMLAVDPEPFSYLNDIFSAPDKEAKRANIDSPLLSFNERWINLANCFMNANDYQPANDWAKYELRIVDVDPRLPPTTPWNGEKLRDEFLKFKSRFAKVDDIFHRSGNMEAGADIEEADRFYGHVQRVLEKDTVATHTLLQFSFWAFDKHPPKFMSRAKLLSDQFDSSAPNNNPETTTTKKTCCL
jgi:hypothetical protein